MFKIQAKPLKLAIMSFFPYPTADQSDEDAEEVYSNISMALNQQNQTTIYLYTVILIPRIGYRQHQGMLVNME